MEAFKDNKKFQDTLKTAKALFWKYGIKRVSIEEICTETPVSKMTFYKFFENKNHLAEIILKGMLNEGYLKYRNIMDKPIPFPEKIKKTIILKNEITTGISDEFIRDAYQDNNSGLLAIMNEYKDRLYKEVLADMTLAQEQGEIRSDIKPEFIMYLLDDISYKVMDEKLTAFYSSKQELTMELTKYFFYGIMNSEK